MVKVEKVDGSKEDYSEAKIKASAGRVGVPGDLQEAMLREIRSKLYDGVKTKEIYETIRSYLGHHDAPHLAAKYNLKAALAELGPSGYPFEKFVAELLSARGYRCATNQVIPGKCVSHEVDVVAEKDETLHFIEAKFHKNPGQRTDIRVALYIHARYLDLQARNRGEHTVPWIVTNTRFSTDALTYAACVSIQLTSWTHPQGEGIADLIEATGLHPVTMLDGLLAEDKRRLLTAGIVTCRQYLESDIPPTLIPENRYRQVLSLAKRVCGGS